MIIITRAKVGEFRGRQNLSSSFSSALTFYPTSSTTAAAAAAEPAEVVALREWFTTTRGAGVRSLRASTSHLTRVPFSCIQTQRLGRGDKPDYITVKGVINTVRSERPWYPACPTCTKKAEEDTSGQWACASCKKRFERPTYRYMLNVFVSDDTGGQSVTLYDEAARSLLNKSADDAEELMHAAPDQFAALMSAPAYTMHLFELAVKNEVIKDEKGNEKTFTRVKAMRLHTINYAEENRLLLAQLA